MLYFSLVLSLVVFVAACAAARPHPQPVRWWRFLVPGAVAVFGPFFVILSYSPVVCWLFVLLILALAVWPYVRRRVPTFFPLSLAAVLVAYGTASWIARDRQAATDRLRKQYPLESMVDRAHAPVGERRPFVNSSGRFAKFEDAVEAESRWTPRHDRLQMLHNDTTSAFVSSPGFGVGRMPSSPTAANLKEYSDREPTPAQPGSPVLWGSAPFTPVRERDELVTLHTDGVLDFVNPRGWGYVRSRDAVAGFIPHRFSKVPTARTFAVQRVELVGLLKHPEPVVYLSDRLPAMADLPNVPTRPLDAFETAGLERVRQGEDGFAASRGEVVRFVGGIRSANQCVQCHGGERGDLLGAFAYTLRANPQPRTTE